MEYAGLNRSCREADFGLIKEESLNILNFPTADVLLLENKSLIIGLGISMATFW